MMRILQINTYDCVALLKYNDYIEIGEYLKKKGDFLPEGYEIAVYDLPFEDFVEECFYEYDGCGYSDWLIGAYEYVNKNAYKLFISREEQEEELNDFTSQRMLNVVDAIKREIEGDQCREAMLISNFLNQITQELTEELKFEVVEADVVDPIFAPKTSRYYKAPITLSQYEIFREFFKYKVIDAEKSNKFDWTDIECGAEGVMLRDSNYNFTDIWIERKNQTYYMGICGYDCYSKGKYSERKYNEYILPSKDVLIKFFETLKYSDYSVPEPFDYISNLMINSIEKYIK
ncbi:MAG: hypothetical protein IJ086_00570 [Clostridium sp.]|nr:hypothetical protein [Clostridium sp.]